jgi:hypothetical protein
MTTYHVSVKLADLTWDLTHDSGDVSDDDRVLPALTFGWRMPEGLWPQQPEPMTASLAINVPDFTSDIADLAEGDPCSIRIGLIGDDPEVDYSAHQVAFYGRITDLKATPRPRRAGVTLSVAAVDYIPDLAELQAWFPTPSIDQDSPAMLEELWDARFDTDFPDWPAEFGAPAIIPVNAYQDVPTRIGHELTQCIGLTAGDPTHRLIIAPVVDSTTELLDTTQAWSFDAIYKEHPDDPYVIPSARIERASLEWLYSKQSWPNFIEVVGDLVNVTTAHVGYSHRRTAKIDVTLMDSDDADNVAEFYLPDPTPSAWRVNTFRLLATRASLPDADFSGLAVMFPILTVFPGFPQRSACYGHPIVLADVPDHINPLAPGAGVSDVTGRLTGASVTITGGHVHFDLQLRQTTAAYEGEL